ncbi:MAG: hypothetical protein QN173_06340 [Armatimonadota bacterium]|nr:hypothetical protein [Armatimonadota bacterium]MDR7401809.1 hypothetical protein [Armatimonadota bacterium]MDR7403111.1 hypothetical protein [Armatimonadota bacterium]MDR7436186.1 hypothetical protein [Armatimonadota bacterium]MDR7471434.1 hypothetical protein [Armatimonadota bacterium]
MATSRWRRLAAEGAVPWRPADLVQAFAHWQDLVGRAARRARVDRHGRVTYALPVGGMGRYFLDRYGREVGLAHLIRWVKVGEFLSEHADALAARRLIWVGRDGALEMDPRLLAVLCRVRYRRRPGTIEPGIALADVLWRLRRRPPPRASGSGRGR